jgi:hypothetical protein
MAVQKVVRKLSTGDKGVDETVSHMRRLALRDSSDRIIRACMQEIRSARQAFDYIVKHVPYVSDPGRHVQIDGWNFKVRDDQEFLVAPKYLLGEGLTGGDCDDMATALASTLVSLGVRCWFKTIAWRRPEFTHVYCLAEVQPGRIIPLDPVKGPGGFGWEKTPILRYSTYPVQ